MEGGWSRKTYKLRSTFIWKGKRIFPLATIFSYKTEDDISSSWVLPIYNFIQHGAFYNKCERCFRQLLLPSSADEETDHLLCAWHRAKHHISINSFTLQSHFQWLVDLGFGCRPSDSICHEFSTLSDDSVDEDDGGHDLSPEAVQEYSISPRLKELGSLLTCSLIYKIK